MTVTKFSSLRLEGWRQFGHVDIALHPRLTVLTGANGAGKSSLLRILHSHFGFQQPFLATPVLQPGGGYSYFTGIFTDTMAKMWQRFWKKRSDMSNVGAIHYSNGVDSELQIPTKSSVQYKIKITNQQSVPGIHLDSHAPITYFQQVGQIPTTIVTAEARIQYLQQRSCSKIPRWSYRLFACISLEGIHHSYGYVRRRKFSRSSKQGGSGRLFGICRGSPLHVTRISRFFGYRGSTAGSHTRNHLW